MVKIYSTPTCTYCQLAKQFFSANNIEYTEIDVAADEEKRNEMISKTGQMGVPVIAIDKDGSEEIIIGFDEDRIRKIFNL